VPGSGDAVAWQKIGKNPSKVLKHGSSSPISDAGQGYSQGAEKHQLILNLTLRQKGIFSAFCGVGSVCEIVRRMNLTQPAVSKAIINLEETIGLRLFDRRKNRLRVTSSGELIRDEAETFLNQAGLSTAEALRRGYLNTVAILSSILGGIGSAVRRFNQSHSGVTVNFDIEMSRDVIELVSQKRADIGFIQGSSLPAPQSVKKQAVATFRSENVPTLPNIADRRFSSRSCTSPRDSTSEDVRRISSPTRNCCCDAPCPL
jgi:DNA-binding transcriptional LysR family regulator